MPPRRLGGATWLLVALGLPWATRPHDGVQLTSGEEAHDLDDLTVSSQLEMEHYQRKKTTEAVDKLKYELGEHPDLTMQTQREGTLREHVVDKSISKDKYWARSGEKEHALHA